MMVGMEPPLSDLLTGMERSVDAVFIEGPDGRVVYANPAGRRLMGGTPEQLTRTGQGATMGADSGLWIPLLEERGRTGSLKGLAPLSRLDGTVFWAGVSSTMFVGEDGEDLAFWIVRDVTSRVQLRRRLEAYDEIVGTLLRGSDTRHALDLMARHACVIFDAAFAAVVTPNSNGLGVTVVAAAGVGAGELIGRTYPPGGLSESIMDSLTPRLIDDITAMTRTDEVRQLGLAAGMIVPIIAGEVAMGTLFIGAGPNRPEYGAEDLEDAEMYAARAGVALALGAARSEAERAKGRLADQLQQALESRVPIEQAKGYISCLRDISTEEAFGRLRAYARSHSTDIHTVARQILDRQLVL